MYVPNVTNYPVNEMNPMSPTMCTATQLILSVLDAMITAVTDPCPIIFYYASINFKGQIGSAKTR